jgi:undecaprenyl-diphosphatase
LTALAVSFFCFDKRIGATLFVGALIVSVARVAAGIHWPLDILAGAVIGAVVAFVITRFRLILGA